MSNIGNERNESFGKQPCVEVTNPSERGFQTEDSMKSTIIISQSMLKAKDVLKQHSITEITTEIIRKKGQPCKDLH